MGEPRHPNGIWQPVGPGMLLAGVYIVYLLATGLVAGILAGLLGVGGGIVIVPVLYHLFTLLGVDESVRMHVTVGTSLATIIPTSIMSSRAHTVALNMAFTRDSFSLADGLPGPVGTGAMLGMVISVPGALAFLVNGLGVPNRPPASLGYVNLLGMAMIVPATLVSTGWGAKLAHTMNARRLRQVFAAFLALTAVRMFYGLLH